MTLTITNNGNSKSVYKEIIERTAMSSNTINKTENSNENVDSTNSPDPNPFLDDIELFSSVVRDISKEDIDNVEIDYCDVIKRVMKK